MKLKLNLLIWLATMSVLTAVSVDQKTSHGSLALGASIDTLDKTKLTGKESAIQLNKDGKEITVEHYQLDTSGLTFGDMPVTSAQVSTVAGFIVDFSLLIDNDTGPQYKKLSDEEKITAKPERRRLLALALIEKYGPPTEPRLGSNSPSPSQQTFLWKGKDVILNYSFNGQVYADSGAIVSFASQRVMDNASAVFLKAQIIKDAEERAKARVLRNDI